MTESVPALVIGAGPAGLMAAEAIADAGLPVLVVDAKPSAGRKFLMAGKSGLNLTKDEGHDRFLGHFAEAAQWLAPILSEFGPPEVQDWSRTLGQEVFTGSSGRVFPKAMKASPLLRAWLVRLRGKGVELRTRWRWTGLSDTAHNFDTPEGRKEIAAAGTVLALGGASWARLGSDGSWATILARHGVDLAPFEASNVGYQVDWSDHMQRWFGAPVKSVSLMAGGQRVRGEVVISARGIEGGGLYALARSLRSGAPLALDLFPDWTVERVAGRLAAQTRKESASNRLRKAFGLVDARQALVHEWVRPLPADPHALAEALKAIPVPLGPPRPIDEAISTAGGIRCAAFDGNLMLPALPGVFVAGEMLDWDAPTGGYLLTACLATGRRAGRAAADWARR
ncbi:TIGR03862 family flavoprotein [Pararhodobacter sp. SW119]|uniref:TIGR03862 family flavoprotein n=1 Tax=Pararhodobacter sp. SW119 TaxID=2780075 RepID=UPI001ADFD856|nr:TIGR03862 family flavoprotein [Pararhodobacter sp. SW119]